MSDKVKERIEKDAATYVSHNWNNVNPDTEKAYIDGATAERPKAWNEAIDKTISELKESIRNNLKIRLQSSARIEQHLSLIEIINHIDRMEKLKHKQP